MSNVKAQRLVRAPVVHASVPRAYVCVPVAGVGFSRRGFLFVSPMDAQGVMPSPDSVSYFSFTAQVPALGAVFYCLRSNVLDGSAKDTRRLIKAMSAAATQVVADNDLGQIVSKELSFRLLRYKEKYHARAVLLHPDAYAPYERFLWYVRQSS